MLNIPPELVLEISKHLHKSDLLSLRAASRNLHSILEPITFYDITVDHNRNIKELLDVDNGNFLKRVGNFIRVIYYQFSLQTINSNDLKLIFKVLEICPMINTLKISIKNDLQTTNSFNILDELDFENLKNQHIQSVENICLSSIKKYVDSGEESNLISNHGEVEQVPWGFAYTFNQNEPSLDNIPMKFLDLFPNLNGLELNGFKISCNFLSSNIITKILTFNSIDCEIDSEAANTQININNNNNNNYHFAFESLMIKHSQSYQLDFREFSRRLELLLGNCNNNLKNISIKTPKEAGVIVGIVAKSLKIPYLGDQIETLILEGFEGLEKSKNHPFVRYGKRIQYI